jgi:hypothetical protein
MPTERERLIEEMVQRYRQTLERQLQREPQTLDEIEQVVEDVSVEMERELEQRILEQVEAPPVNQASCPQCRTPARYRATHPRVLLTRHGERVVHRRYFYCPRCAQGFSPLDTRLGLDAGATTQAVRLAVVQLAAHVPFATATHLLAQLFGVTLGASTVERIAVAVGTALQTDQHAAAQQHQHGLGPSVARKPERLYVSVDGIFAPLRDPWKKDGSGGALHCRWGECKTAVVYAARPTPAGDQGVLWREYTATFAAVEQFGPLVATLAHRCGHHFARELIFLADGQAYNWSLAAAHFPTALQSVDFMHAVQHLYSLAHALFGEGTSPVAPWVEARKSELCADRVADVLTAIADLPARTAAQAEAQRREWGYFRTNAERMRYGTFRKRGYQIASGVMEATCKHVVHQRLDQAGMHWRPETAEAVVALRAALLSSQSRDLRPYCAAH